MIIIHPPGDTRGLYFLNFLTKLKKLRGKLIKKTKNENDAKFSFNNYKFLRV